MDTQDIVETWRREGIQEGIERGIKRGIEQGIKRGIEQGIARSLIDIHEARFGAISPELRAVIEDTHDEPTLRGWVRLAITHTADELAAAIRSLRTR